MASLLPCFYLILFQAESAAASSSSSSWLSIIGPITSIGSIVAIYRFFKLERRESDDAVSKAQDVFFARLDQRDRAFLESLTLINTSLSAHSTSISSLKTEIESLRQHQERTSFFLLTVARTGTQPWTEDSIAKTLKMIREEKI